MWKSLQDAAAKHAHSMHEAHEIAHLAYFALVFTHGPYYWLAGVCFVIGVATLALKVTP